MLPFDETSRFEARVGKILLLIAVTAMAVFILCSVVYKCNKDNNVEGIGVEQVQNNE